MNSIDLVHFDPQAIALALDTAAPQSGCLASNPETVERDLERLALGRRANI